jgi:hypothetical protein
MEDRNASIKEAMKLNFKDNNTKSKLIQAHAFYSHVLICSSSFLVSKDGLRGYCQFLELFVREGVFRAEKRAEAGGSSTVEFEHLEQVFVQLLLDF